MPELGLFEYILLFAAGLVAGTLNVVAGGGSFLTLPVLIFLGLPAGIANGTNRVGILIQNLGAIWGFQKHRVVQWNLALWAALPAGVGSVFGTLLALQTPDAAFQRILALLMAGITLWTLFGKSVKPGGEAGAGLSRPLLAAGFFLVGIYGGFVQAGVGFLILAVTTWAGLDLVRGNAVKVLSIFAFTIISLAIFAWQGRVEWVTGFVLATGTLLGGQLGVHLTVLKGHTWIRRVVTIMVLIFAVRLWFS